VRIVCDSCKSRFEFDDSRIPANGVRIRCANCSHVFSVTRRRVESDSNKRLVPPGRYVVSRSKDGTLEAHLGTSVGVTLYDRRADVGGLIHLLLPEPPSTEKPRQPERYAATGLLLFLQALSELGARKERLEACVAGGALMGSSSEPNLNLDIGGRTTEAVEYILRRAGISVYRSQTGGCLGCRLSLSLRTWKSEVRPIGIQDTPAGRNFKKPTPEQLERSIQKARPIPQIVLKALRMIRDENYGMEDVARVIRQDQVTSARILRLCNSALFGLGRTIDSIDRALILLGEKRFVQLIIAAELEGFFPQAEQGYSLCKGGLYNHALGTAIFAETLAKFTGKGSPDVAYTAGLLHDIGKVLLDQHLASVYPLFYQRIQTDGDELIEVERETFGISHPEMGWRLANHWSLPEVLRETIKYHHHPEKATADPELTHLVYVSDLIVSGFVVGQDLERLNADKFTRRLAKTGLSPSHLPIIIDLIPQEVFETSMLASIYS